MQLSTFLVCLQKGGEWTIPNHDSKTRFSIMVFYGFMKKTGTFLKEKTIGKFSFLRVGLQSETSAFCFYF